MDRSRHLARQEIPFKKVLMQSWLKSLPTPMSPIRHRELCHRGRHVLANRIFAKDIQDPCLTESYERYFAQMGHVDFRATTLWVMRQNDTGYTESEAKTSELCTL